MWNNERLITSIIILIFGIPGLFIATNYKIYDGINVGPGGAPTVYLIGLIVSGIAIFIKAPKTKDGSIQGLIAMPGRRGFTFALLMVAMGFAIHVIGYSLSLFVFSFVGFLLTTDLRATNAALYSAALALILHLVFVNVLGVPLEQGLLFER